MCLKFQVLNRDFKLDFLEHLIRLSIIKFWLFESDGLGYCWQPAAPQLITICSASICFVSHCELAIHCVGLQLQNI